MNKRIFFFMMIIFLVSSLLVAEGMRKHPESDKRVSLKTLKKLSDNELGEKIKAAIADVKDDDLRLQNVKEIRELIKERQAEKKSLAKIKKAVRTEFLKTLNEAEKDSPLTQDMATLLSDLEEVGTTDTEKIRIKRAQVFKEMKWRENKYNTKKEKEFANNFKDYSNRHREMNLILHQYKPQDNTDLMRPLSELIFDLHSSQDGRIAAIKYLGYMGDKRAITVLKKILKSNTFNINIRVANALYNIGEKDLAFKTFVVLIKQGYFISHSFLVKVDVSSKKFDPYPKKYLEEIILCKNNPPMQVLAAAYLYGLGSKAKAKKIYEDVKLRLEQNQIQERIKETKATLNYYEKIINWLSGEMKNKNEK